MAMNIHYVSLCVYVCVYAYIYIHICLFTYLFVYLFFIYRARERERDRYHHTTGDFPGKECIVESILDVFGQF